MFNVNFNDGYKLNYMHEIISIRILNLNKNKKILKTRIQFNYFILNLNT